MISKNRKKILLIITVFTLLFTGCNSNEVINEDIGEEKIVGEEINENQDEKSELSLEDGKNSMKDLYEGLIDDESILVDISTSENNENDYVVTSANGFLLDTSITISIYEDDKEVSDQVILNSFKIIRSLEGFLSRHIETSDVNNVNANAGLEKVVVSEYTMEVVNKGLEYSIISDGKFDITTGSLIEEWGIMETNPQVPGEDDIAKSLELVNYEKIIIDEDENTIYLEDKGMIMDLGAIAKGYIADVVKGYLTENGVESGIINLGGNVLTIGEKPTNSPWKIGVQKPSDIRGFYVGILQVFDKTLVSSGSYERYFEENGVRYHHIISTEDGYPVDNKLAQTTILTEKSVDGDGFSTTLFSLGLEGGMEYAKSNEEIEVIFVTDDKKVYIEESLKSVFTETEEDYEYIYY